MATAGGWRIADPPVNASKLAAITGCDYSLRSLYTENIGEFTASGEAQSRIGERLMNKRPIGLLRRELFDARISQRVGR
jgi:hypothetical protein